MRAHPNFRLYALVALLWTGTAQAHYLWIEHGKDESRVYFGEPDALLKEKSPGKLDNIQEPKAFLQARPGMPPASAQIERKDEYFLGHFKWQGSFGADQRRSYWSKGLDQVWPWFCQIQLLRALSQGKSRTHFINNDAARS